MKKLILLSFLTLIFSCQNNPVDYSYPENPENIRKQRAGKFFDDVSFSSKKAEQKIVDKIDKKTSSPIWVASIEVISALLPISTADENSGLIITEWYQDGKSPNDRIKINLLVKGKESIKENLILTIFRQTKNDQGVWVDEQSTNQSLSAQMIKDKIIEKTKSK
jgi:hypothetical protein